MTGSEQHLPSSDSMIDVLVGVDAAGNVYEREVRFEAPGEAQSALRTMLFREWDEHGIRPVFVASDVRLGHGLFRENVHD